MRFRLFLDKFGSTASILCAVHCAVLPVLIAVLPALGLSALAWSGFEWAFVCFATLLGGFSLWIGYKRHRVYRALAFLMPGLTLVWLGILWPDIHHDLLRHAIVMTAGGTLIAIAHLVNLRLTHGHVHDADCGHQH
ncbi:MAG: MerC domain-containing protein [Arenimonas sp.]|uniref:MerC domain-containing protein n=1 Tax=Arenimonas sp. TaxID=1872635 RepID=UPI003C0043C2